MENRILNHLVKNGIITTREAIKEYGCTRLPQYIYLLRNKGYLIQDRQVSSVNRFGEKASFKQYYLLKMC